MDPTSLYVMSVEEVAWGSSLVAITMVMHAVSMLLILRVTRELANRIESERSHILPVAPVLTAAWMITLTHLAEVGVWAGFFSWKGLLPNGSISYSFALLSYTTLGSEYYLPLHWRLLEGMLAMAGLMTFAWSTGVLLTLVQVFQDWHLKRWSRERMPKSPSAPVDAPSAKGPD